MASDDNNVETTRSGEPLNSQPDIVTKTDASQRLNTSSPPTYEEAMDPSGGPPPSYESLFGRVREVHKESSGTVDFVKNVFLLLLGTIGCTIVVGITTVIPVCMLIVGSMYLNDCPANKYIPIYLLVGGVFGCLKQLLSMYERSKNSCRNPEGNTERKEKTNSLQNLIACFMLPWFIAGSYWVYSLDKPNFKDHSSPRYCAKTAYYFAFWQITLVYIMLCLTMCCFCLASGGLVMFARRLDSNANTPQDQS